MNGKEVYKIYAPQNAKWVNYVRPVPFVAIDLYNRKPVSNWIDRKQMFLNTYENNTAIFIDLPGKDSIELGISLAKLGYRPIPIFNGTDSPIKSKAILDNESLESALINSAERLKMINLSNDASPAFILDSNRINRFRENETIFDNSWDLYKQDMPSYQYFKENGINKIIVVGNKINIDLKRIFIDFQKNGIEFYLTDGYSIPSPVFLKKSLKEKFEKEDII